jgi:hypothetical protein
MKWRLTLIVGFLILLAPFTMAAYIDEGQGFHPTGTNAYYLAAEDMNVSEVHVANTFVEFNTTDGFSNLTKSPASETYYQLHDIAIQFYHLSTSDTRTNVSFNVSGSEVSAEYLETTQTNTTVVLPEGTYNISYTWQGRTIEDSFTVDSDTNQLIQFEVNRLPTAPTDLIYWGAYTDWTLEAEANGSTDDDSDSIEYYYQFADSDGTILQSYSTTPSISTDGYSMLQISAKAMDETGEFSDSISVNATIEDISGQNETYTFDSGWFEPTTPTLYSGSVDLRNTTLINYANVSVSINDPDGNIDFTNLTLNINGEMVFDGIDRTLFAGGEIYSGAVTDFLTASQLNTFNLSANYYNGYGSQQIVIVFNVFSDYDTFIENLQILPEKASEFNTSNIDNVEVVVYCSNGTVDEYSVDTADMNLSMIPIDCSYEYISTIIDWPTYSYQRNQIPDATLTNMTFYMIDVTQTPYVVDNIYFTSEMSYDWVVLYSSTYGNLDWKQVDLSNKVSFQMVQNVPYQIHVYDGSEFVRSVGNIASSASETFYVSLDPYMSTVSYSQGVNISYEVENSSIRVIYEDPESLTDWVRLEIFNSSDDSILYNSTVSNSSVIFTYNVDTINQTFMSKVTYYWNGETFEAIRYIRNGEVLSVPGDIPEWFLVGGIAFILVAIALVFPAGVGGIGAAIVSVLVALFDFLGLITLPAGMSILLMVVGAAAFIISMRRGGAV